MDDGRWRKTLAVHDSGRAAGHALSLWSGGPSHYLSVRLGIVAWRARPVQAATSMMRRIREQAHHLDAAPSWGASCEDSSERQASEQAGPRKAGQSGGVCGRVKRQNKEM